MRSPAAPTAPDRVPTLTEVVVWPPADASMPSIPPALSLPPAPTPALRLAEDEIVQSVLLQLQRQVDLMLEYRLREVLTPVLARAADGIVRDARSQLASTLRAVVERAVGEELARRRGA